tara:strand:+ start:1820 stop:2314 length:495 start_codon:yes stop_codon:yes gene_type:complete
MRQFQRINGDIRERVVCLIMPDGHKHGDVNIEDARTMAHEQQLDLVEVSPRSNGHVPICKLLDYGKLKYKESKRKQHRERAIKEVRISKNISDHDLKRKRSQVLKFVEKGFKVKYTLELKGRERKDPQSLLGGFLDELKNLGDVVVFDKPSVSNRGISCVLRRS